MEPERARSVRHHLGDDVIDILERRLVNLKIVLANSVKRSIFDRKNCLGILNELIDGQN